MANFDAAKVRFGKPGVLYVAALNAAGTDYLTATEPTTVSSAWGTGWYNIGYTVDGSTFTYETTVNPVEVAEELLPIGYAPSGGSASVTFAAAETTKRNWQLVTNGGVLTTPDGQNWTFEPADFGAEVRVALGWDAVPTVADNDLRFIFRKCIQGGSTSTENKKGAAVAALSSTWNLEKPAGSTKFFKILGAGKYNTTN